MENKIKFDKETFYLSNPDSKNQNYCYYTKNENIENSLNDEIEASAEVDTFLEKEEKKEKEEEEKKQAEFEAKMRNVHFKSE